MSINATALSGSIVRQDCELRTTASGKSVARFTLCWQRPIKNAKGEWENVPGYIGVVLFGSRAEALAPKLTRGTKVAVQGELRYSTWEKDGQKRSTVELAAKEIEYMSRKPEHAAEPEPELYGEEVPF